MNLNRLAFLPIVRSTIKKACNYYTVQSTAVKPQTDITKLLCYKIKATGPVTIAEYMKEVLINPASGYYMHNDVFGPEGDFVTSPELGQIFGEMIAIWFLNEWSKAGSPKPVQIVELGPGRGTLCQDILRVFKQFRLDNISVHLVEVSPHLSDLQAKRLCMQSEINLEPSQETKFKTREDSLAYKEGQGTCGIPVSWYKHIDDVPNAFTLLVAHEFFDALPIHKFQKTDRGYREVLIDVDPLNDSTFRFVLSNSETVIGKLFIQEGETRSHLEISPESLVLAEKIASRIEKYGGLALIADYGHDGSGTDTFRAFKKHQLHDPLVNPGTADLTADVDFAALKRVATEKNEVLAFGPVSQRDFLLNMGMEYRLQKLKETANEEQKKSLDYSFHMMTDPDKMGHKFKFLALVPSVLDKILQKYPLTGFKFYCNT